MCMQFNPQTPILEIEILALLKFCKTNIGNMVVLNLKKKLPILVFHSKPSVQMYT